MNILQRQLTSRDLSGPAASVLLALLLSGGTQTAESLASDWTNMSVPTVTLGLQRLAQHQLVTHYGKREGWSLNFNQLQLWQGHSGILLSENATNGNTGGSVASVLKASNKSGGFKAPTAPITVDNPVDNCEKEEENKSKNFAFNPPSDYENPKDFRFLPHTRADQIRSDLKQSDFKESVFKESDQIRHEQLEQLIVTLGIRPPGNQTLLDANPDPAVFYGWYLWALEPQQKWINSASAWALKCTLAGDKPQAKWFKQAVAALAAGDISATPGVCPECLLEDFYKDGVCLRCSGVIRT